MIVTLDTNVIYQGLRSPNGPAAAIIDMARSELLQLAISNSVLTEYEDVLLRPSTLADCRATKQEAIDLLLFIASMAVDFDIYFLFRPNLSDEADNMLVELALTSNSRFLITNNIRDFMHNAELKFSDLNIVTPVEFLRFWRNYHV